jgi:hypothetical protein
MIFGNNELVWWTGVVEDRDDPEKLGRCRVRVFGHHTADTISLPTSDLPWALPMQSITSAATSGVGSAPVGIVPGTWVVGWFMDGSEMQRPLIIGTLAGKPSPSVASLARQAQDKSINNVVKSSGGEALVNQDNTYLVKTDKNSQPNLGPLTQTNLNTFLKTFSEKVSGGNYAKESSAGDLGKYQLSVNALIDLGYVKRCPEDIVSATWTADSNNWTGKDGITSKTKFLEDTAIQESAVVAASKINYNTLLRMGKISDKDDPKDVAGLLATSLAMGVTNADKLNKKDINGKLAKDYFVAVNTALGGNARDFEYKLDAAGNFLPSTNNTNTNNAALNNSALNNIKGFQDPNKKYPSSDYTGVSDINKLAVGDVTHKSFNVKKNRKIDNIQLANSKQTWNEPDSAYGAGYPYNQVTETEAGHLIELDSTPGAERIHIFHKTGTYIEIDVNGSMVRKTVGDNYEVIDRNNLVYVKGAQCITVEGKTSILVKDDAKIQVEGDLAVTSHGNTLVQSAGQTSIISENLRVTAAKSFSLVSEGPISMQGKGINFYSKDGDIVQKASGDFLMESGRASTMSINGGLETLIEGATVKQQSGAVSIQQIDRPIDKLPEKKSPDKTPIPLLQREVVSKATFYHDAGDEGTDAYKLSLEQLGLINTSITPKVVEGEAILSAATPIIKVNDEDINKFTFFPRSFILSNKDNRIFTLDDMLKDGGLVAQRGLTEKQIVYNLKQLTVNCLDPIKAKFPDMKINSVFRPVTTTVTGSNAETSDHGLGAAADIKFTNTRFKDYSDIAQWIVQNIPHRQIILEYAFESGNNKLRSAWIHIAFLTANGTIVKSSKPPVQTFANHTPVSKSLVNLA